MTGSTGLAPARARHCASGTTASHVRSHAQGRPRHRLSSRCPARADALQLSLDRHSCAISRSCGLRRLRDRLLFPHRDGAAGPCRPRPGDGQADRRYRQLGAINRSDRPHPLGRLVPHSLRGRAARRAGARQPLRNPRRRPPVSYRCPGHPSVRALRDALPHSQRAPRVSAREPVPHHLRRDASSSAC